MYGRYVYTAAATLNNVIDDIAAILTGQTNSSLLAAAAETEIFMDPETTSASTQIDLGIEASPLGSTLSIADETTAPAGVTFAHYNSASKLALPDIAAGAYCRVWVRRVVTAAAPNTLLDQGSFVVWAA